MSGSARAPRTASLLSAPVAALSGALTKLVQRYLPDPWVFALVLTGLVFLLALGLTATGPANLVVLWGDGFWNLLAFTMQMALVLVTGHALASTALVGRALEGMAAIARTPGQGVMLVAFSTGVACLINWGFGLVVGAMFARAVARRVRGSDYRLLIASAYIGFMTWHGGFSGSIPLVAATKGNPMEKTIGLIPIADTLLTPYNVVITIGLLILLPLLCRMMQPPPGQAVTIDPALLAAPPSAERILPRDAGIAERLEESRIVSLAIGLFGVAYLVIHFLRAGFELNINLVNLIMVIAGVLLHKTPMAYARAIANAARGTAGILIQFPFYAGIQGMLEGSGLGGVITNGFVAIADRDTFPVLAFLSSGLINFAVPSGGGHWVVQGPFIMPAAQALGADLGKAAMAIAYGEEWMNMAQPFWALPALAIAGLGVRDIMGFCATTLIFTLPLFLLALYFL